MGKHINLADLADEDFYVPDTTPTSTDPQHEILSPTGPPSASATSPTAAWPESDWMLVPIDSIALNPLNARYPGEDEEIEGLAETIRGRTKVIQPMVVCTAAAFADQFPDQATAIGDTPWVVLIGNRRLMASRRAAVDDHVRVIVNDDLAASMHLAMLIENGHHRSLPPLLEAEAMTEAMRQHGFSQRELARRLGKSHPYVIQRLALLKLIAPLKSAFERGELKIELARQLGELSPAEQRRVVEAGKPYRLPGGNGVTTRSTRARTIRVSTPAIAAASIRERFSADELTELIRLLTEATAEMDAASPADDR